MHLRRTLLLSIVATLTALALPSAAFGGPGDLDPSFDGDGKLTTAFGTTPFHAADRGNASARGPSGEVYVAGTTPAQGGNFAVVRYTSAGVLDTTFGTGGIVSTDISGAGSADQANAVTVDGSGNILVAGTTGNNEFSDFALVRYTSAGALDTSFGGGDGIVTTNFPAGVEDDGSAVAVLPSGNLAVAGTTNTDSDPEDEVQDFDFALAVYTSAGALDGNVDGDGLVTTDFGSDDDGATAVRVTSGPKIIVAGTTDPVDPDDSGDFALARYDAATGAPDNTFDSDAKQTVSFTDTPGNGDRAAALAVDGTGRIVVAGSVPTGNSDFGVARLLASGALDTAGFSGDGKATINFPSTSSADRGLAVAVDSSDNVVIAGQTGTENGSIGAGAQFLLAKFDSAGAPDAGFGGGDGLITTDFKPAEDLSDGATGVFVDGTKIVATGTGNDNFAAARYAVTDGSLDTTFGTASSGKVETDIVSPIASSEAARGVAVQPDGKVVVVGPTNAGPTSQFRGDQDFGLSRYNADGSPDTSFGGGDGLVTTNFDGGVSPDNGTQDTPTGVALQSDGKIVVVGKTNPIGPDAGDVAVARYEADGDPDSDFDTDGIVTTDFGGGAGGSGGDYANAVTLKGTAGDPGFQIVVAGARSGATQFGEDFAIAAYGDDGALDATFAPGGSDGDGKQTTDFGSGDVAHGVAVQADGSIVAAGGINNSLVADFAVARYLSTGAPDPAFGGGSGRVTTDFAAGFDEAHAVTVEELGGGQVRIVLAGQGNDGSAVQGALAAYTTDGSLDPSFAPGGVEGDGKATYDLQAAGNIEALRDVLIQPDGKLLASGSVEAGDFGLIRVSSTGALDAGFGGDGLVSTTFPNPNSQQLSAFGLAIQPDGKIVAAGGAQIPFNGSDFMVARYGTTDPAPVVNPPAPVQQPPVTTPKKKKCKKGFVKKKVKGKKKCVKKKRK